MVVIELNIMSYNGREFVTEEEFEIPFIYTLVGFPIFHEEETIMR